MWNSCRLFMAATLVTAAPAAAICAAAHTMVAAVSLADTGWDSPPTGGTGAAGGLIADDTGWN